MIETKTIPVPPWKGLYLDGVTVPGGMSKADNVFVLPDGSLERRRFQRTLTESPASLAGRGFKSVFELRKADGEKYIFADLDNEDVNIEDFSTELIANFAGWTDPGAAWSYGSTKWTHTTGTTSLVATGETAIVAGTKYRVVTNVTMAAPSSSGTGWAYTRVDSGLTCRTANNTQSKIWVSTWTHTSGTTALSATRDFTVIAGETYRVIVHVTHTSGTSLSVYIGGVLAGTITATGLYDYVVPFVTDATALRFVPTNDWVGSITKAWPHIPNKLDDWVSVVKFIDPAGANIPSNYELAPNSWDVGGKYETDLTYFNLIRWHPEAVASSSQSIAVYLGATLAGVIQESGEFTYDVTATTTAALTYVPTNYWDGSVDSASVVLTTYESVASTRMKIIGGTVTGTTDYETSWANVITNLATGTTVVPMYAVMQDRAFRTDGTNINYYFRDTTKAHTLGVPSPVDPPVTASTTGGDIVIGSYNIYYSYVKKDGDYVVNSNPSPVSNTDMTIDSALGAELVDQFASWNVVGTWTYGATKWSHTTGDATPLTATITAALDFTPAVGTTYKVVVVNTTATAGSGFVVSMGGESQVAVTATGTNTYYITAVDATVLSITPTLGTWVGSIDSMSVKAMSATAITVAVIANPDTDITHIRIYRTLYNELGADAYLDQEVTNETQTVTLTSADDIIGDGTVLEYNHDMAKRAMFVAVGGSRLWLLRFPGEVGGDSMLMWSEVGLPEYFPALNHQTFDPDDGDVCMGMAILKDNLLVFKRRITFSVSMYSFGKDIVSPTIGCVASGSIQAVGLNSAIWLSAEGVMLYDGGEPRNISKDRINTVINDFMAHGAEYYIDSVYHSAKRQYHINFIYRSVNSRATGSITSSGTNVTAGDTVTVDTKVYTFVAYADPIGVEGSVRMGTAAAGSLANLMAAINHTGTYGVDYMCAVAHPTVMATACTATVLSLSARTHGSTGNAIALAKSATTLTLSGSLLTGGAEQGATILSQRHFVYALDADAWTEYVYTSTAGARYYEINFCLASDSNLTEVVLVPFLVTSSATTTYIYQTDYEEPEALWENPKQLIDSVGASGTALDKPVYSFNDSSNNTYVISDTADIFKITSAGVKTCICTGATLEALVGHEITVIQDVAVDLTNECFYLCTWYAGV